MRVGATVADVRRAFEVVYQFADAMKETDAREADRDYEGMARAGRVLAGYILSEERWLKRQTRQKGTRRG